MGLENILILLTSGLSSIAIYAYDAIWISNSLSGSIFASVVRRDDFLGRFLLFYIFICNDGIINLGLSNF